MYDNVGRNHRNFPRTLLVCLWVAGLLMLASALASAQVGQAWAWGWNNTGQLGDGTKVNKKTPEPFSGVTGMVQISSGVSHTLALKSDGTVWAWGNNSGGQLGDGTYTDRLTPVQISALSG